MFKNTLIYLVCWKSEPCPNIWLDPIEAFTSYKKALKFQAEHADKHPNSDLEIKCMVVG